MMESMKIWIAAAVAGLLVTACSGGGPDAASPGLGPSPAPGISSDGTEDSGGTGESGPGGRDKKGAGKSDSGGSGPSEEDGGGEDGSSSTSTTSESDSEGAGSGSDDGQGSGPGTRRPGGGSDGGSNEAVAPQAGRYVYAQGGYEEFCSPSCERYDLPPRQRVEARRSGSSGAVTVVTEAHMSGDRVLRTTTRYTPQSASITDVHTSFNYEGFKFSQTYHPQPPVTSMQLPLDVGAKWSGSWQDDTSGDYRVEVLRREAVTAGGKTCNCFVLDTFTRFRGDFQGTADITAWIDPATNVPVRSRGKIDLTTAFGRYKTAFLISLATGPGY